MDVSETLKQSLDKALADSNKEIKDSLSKLIDEKSDLINSIAELKLQQTSLDRAIYDRETENKQKALLHIDLEQKTADLERAYKEKIELKDAALKNKQQDLEIADSALKEIIAKNKNVSDEILKQAEERLQDIEYREQILSAKELELDNQIKGARISKEEFETKNQELATQDLALTLKEQQLDKLAKELEPKHAEVTKKLDELNNGILVKTAELKSLSQKIETRQNELTLEKKAIILKEQDLKKREIRLADREAVNNFNRST